MFLPRSSALAVVSESRKPTRDNSECGYNFNFLFSVSATAASSHLTLTVNTDVPAGGQPPVGSAARCAGYSQYGGGGPENNFLPYSNNHQCTSMRYASALSAVRTLCFSERQILFSPANDRPSSRRNSLPMRRSPASSSSSIDESALRLSTLCARTSVAPCW